MSVAERLPPTEQPCDSTNLVECISVGMLLMLQLEKMLKKILSSVGTEMVETETVLQRICYSKQASKLVIHNIPHVHYPVINFLSLPLHVILFVDQLLLAALLPNYELRFHCLLPKADSSSLTKFDVVLLPKIERPTGPTAKGLWSGANRSILRLDFAQLRAVASTLSPRSLK